jgi:hypothetical protein
MIFKLRIIDVACVQAHYLVKDKNKGQANGSKQRPTRHLQGGMEVERKG